MFGVLLWCCNPIIQRSLLQPGTTVQYAHGNFFVLYHEEAVPSLPRIQHSSTDEVALH